MNRLCKIYIICQDNEIFKETDRIEIFRYRDRADHRRSYLETKAVEESRMLYNQNKPLPKYNVHGFYLLHERLVRD